MEDLLIEQAQTEIVFLKTSLEIRRKLGQQLLEKLQSIYESADFLGSTVDLSQPLSDLLPLAKQLAL